MMMTIYLIEPISKVYPTLIVMEESEEKARIAASAWLNARRAVDNKDKGSLVMMDNCYLNSNSSSCKQVHPKIIRKYDSGDIELKFRGKEVFLSKGKAERFETEIEEELNFQNVLFSKTQQRLLGLLYCQPDTEFYTNEIIRLTDIGTGAIQRELEKLTHAGIVMMKKVGNQKRYQANQQTPLFSELRSIVLKTFGLADVLRAALAPVATQIRIAFIYGSVPRHEDTAKSDIDLMLICDNLAYADVFHLLEATEKQFGKKVNPTCYSPAEWKRKFNEGSHFITKIMVQSKIFLIGTEDELRELR